MNLIEIFQTFPTQESCIDHLEKVRWSNSPTCPYCFTDKRITKQKGEKRYHCNNCQTGFSVTVNTIFHDTKLPLQKWFLAITLMLNAKKGISAKQLERDLRVTYKTAWYMAMRIRRAMLDQKEMLMGIVEVDETYIGGKPRKSNSRKGKKPLKRGRGTTKTPVVGLVERGKNNYVFAQVANRLTADNLNDLVRQRVNRDFSVVITDEYRGYDRLNTLIKHLRVNHKVTYSYNDINTNTIESFWALLKRGIIGQFHKVSDKYLPLYLAEFCYRYNQRENEQLFDMTINNSLKVKVA
jgi:transposase-like protein